MIDSFDTLTDLQKLTEWRYCEFIVPYNEVYSDYFQAAEAARGGPPLLIMVTNYPPNGYHVFLERPND